MTTLDRVVFNGPVALHGRIVREVVRGARIAVADGTLGPAWELHLHAEWQCVVVGVGDDTELVPLQHIRSMALLGRQEAGSPDWLPPLGAPPTGRPRGRPRVKQLGLVRE